MESPSDEFRMNLGLEMSKLSKMVVAKFRERRQCELRRIPLLGTSVNRDARGHYEPLHSTLSSTFCASGACSPNSIVVTVNPFTSFKTIKRNLLLAETKAGE
jgi:hypothetical protein